MKPRFRAGDFAGGLSDAIDRLTGLVKGENLPVPERRGRAVSAGQLPIDGFGLLIFLFFGIIMVGSLLRSLFGNCLLYTSRCV